MRVLRQGASREKIMPDGNGVAFAALRREAATGPAAPRSYSWHDLSSPLLDSCGERATARRRHRAITRRDRSPRRQVVILLDPERRRTPPGRHRHALVRGRGLGAGSVPRQADARARGHRDRDPRREFPHGPRPLPRIRLRRGRQRPDLGGRHTGRAGRHAPDLAARSGHRQLPARRVPRTARRRHLDLPETTRRSGFPTATSSTTPATASRTWRPSWSCCSRPSTPARRTRQTSTQPSRT